MSESDSSEGRGAVSTTARQIQAKAGTGGSESSPTKLPKQSGIVFQLTVPEDYKANVKRVVNGSKGRERNWAVVFVENGKRLDDGDLKDETDIYASLRALEGEIKGRIEGEIKAEATAIFTTWQDKDRVHDSNLTFLQAKAGAVLFNSKSTGSKRKERASERTSMKKKELSDQLELAGQKAQSSGELQLDGDSSDQSQDQSFDSFAEALQVCLLDLKKRSETNIQECNDVHPVLNGIMLFALKDRARRKKAQVGDEGVVSATTTSTTSDVPQHWNQSDQVWFAIESWNEDKVQGDDYKEKLEAFVKEVKKYVYEGNDPLVVVGKKVSLPREADMLVVRHTIPFRREQEQSAPQTQKGGEKNEGNEEEPELYYVTHPGRVNGCHARSVVLACEWKRRRGNTSDFAEYGAIGELMRDFGLQTAKHFQKRARKGFGLLSDGLKWTFYVFWLDHTGGGKVRYQARNFELDPKSADFNGKLATLVQMIQAFVRQSEGEDGWKEECVGKGDSFSSHVLSLHGTLVVAGTLPGGDTGKPDKVVFKYASDDRAIERLKNEANALKNIEKACDAKKNDHEEAVGKVRQMLPRVDLKGTVCAESEAARIRDGLQMLVDDGRLLVFDYKGVRLDQWCVCDQEKAKMLISSVLRHNNRDDDDDDGKRKAADIALYGTSKLWQQLKAVHEVGFVLVDIYQSNIVWDGKEDGASFVDFETLQRDGEEPKDILEAEGFDVFGSQKSEFNAFFKKHNQGQAWDEKTVNKWVDLFKMGLVENWVEGRLERSLGRSPTLLRPGEMDKIRDSAKADVKHTSPKRAGTERLPDEDSSDEANKRTKSNRNA